MSDSWSFQSQFLARLSEAERQIQAQQAASYRPFQARLKRLAKRFLGHKVDEVYKRKIDVLLDFSNHYEELAQFYGWLGDERSKSLILDLMVRKVCGFQFVTPIVDLYSENTRFERARKAAVRNGHDSPISSVAGFELKLFDLHDFGYPITAYWHEMNVVWTFVSEQYRYCHDGTSVGIAEGDVVIDIGACWGDTALYFASKGAAHVYSFEFLTENLAVLRRNLQLNPLMARSISVAENAVWSQDGLELAIDAAGPATAITSSARHLATARSVTIDSFVTEHQLDRVDYIKMDIEGAEHEALRGAEQTIRRFGPKLAIAIYHKIGDFYTIPHVIMNLRDDYLLFVDHFTIGSAETVLFAVPQR